MTRRRLRGEEEDVVEVVAVVVVVEDVKCPNEWMNERTVDERENADQKTLDTC